MRVRVKGATAENAQYWLLVVSIATAVGCDVSRDSDSGATESASSSATTEDVDAWYGLYLNDQRAGRLHWQTETVRAGGRTVIRSRSEMVLSTRRGSDATNIQIETDSTLGQDGALVRYSETVQLGNAPQKTSGRVEGETLTLQSSGAGTRTVPWPQGGRGPQGVELSLREKPLKPGERRTLTVLTPMLHDATSVSLAAVDWETPERAEGRRLLRVDAVRRLRSGRSSEERLWVDEQGAVWLQLDLESGVEARRTTREIAMQSGGEIDLMDFTTVRIERPRVDPRQAKHVVYRVHLDGGRAADVFHDGPMQSVEAEPNGDALVTVDVGNLEDVKPPAAEALAASSLIQTRDRAIVDLASFAAPKGAQPAEIATGVQDFVHGYLTTKDYSQAFASAAEAAQSRRGDCTEHSVLAAALARARGVPARAAMGLVYLGDTPAFGFHMWNEMFVDGAWRPYDATLGKIGPGHLRVSDSLLGGDSELEGLLPIANLLGRLSIEIKSIE